MNKVLEKVQETKEKMEKISRNIYFLEKKKMSLQNQLEEKEKEVNDVKVKLLEVLSSSAQKNGSHILSRYLLNNMEKLVEEKEDIICKIKRIDYHIRKARKKQSFFQGIVSDFPEFYFHSL